MFLLSLLVFVGISSATEAPAHKEIVDITWSRETWRRETRELKGTRGTPTTGTCRRPWRC